MNTSASRSREWATSACPPAPGALCRGPAGTASTRTFSKPAPTLLTSDPPSRRKLMAGPPIPRSVMDGEKRTTPGATSVLVKRLVRDPGGRSSGIHAPASVRRYAPSPPSWLTMVNPRTSGQCSERTQSVSGSNSTRLFGRDTGPTPGLSGGAGPPLFVRLGSTAAEMPPDPVGWLGHSP